MGDILIEFGFLLGVGGTDGKSTALALKVTSIYAEGLHQKGTLQRCNADVKAPSLLMWIGDSHALFIMYFINRSRQP